MIYIYMNAVLSAVGAIVVSMVIVGFTCLMKRKINNTRYKHNISIFYYHKFCFKNLRIFLFSSTSFILNEVYSEIWQFVLVSAEITISYTINTSSMRIQYVHNIYHSYISFLLRCNKNLWTVIYSFRSGCFSSYLFKDICFFFDVLLVCS